MATIGTSRSDSHRILKKNGYVLEQLFSPLVVHTTPEHAELMAICNPRQAKHPKAQDGDTSPYPLPGRGGEGMLSAGGLDSGVAEVSGGLPAKAPENGNPGQGTNLKAQDVDTSPCPLPDRGGEGILTASDGASGVITRQHAHHYFGFAETQWKLFEKERPRRMTLLRNCPTTGRGRP